MEKQEYPKWLYHASGDAKIVRDAAAHEQAGAWWFEHPLTAAAAAARAAAAVTGDVVPMTVPEPPPDAIATWYAAKVKAAVGKVLSMDSIDELRELREIEAQRPGGARPVVARAIVDRIGALQPAPVEAT